MGVGECGHDGLNPRQAHAACALRYNRKDTAQFLDGASCMNGSQRQAENWKTSALRAHALDVMAVPGLDPGIGPGHPDPVRRRVFPIAITGSRPVMTKEI